LNPTISEHGNRSPNQLRLSPVEEYRKGGYEASVSFYGETLGETMVEGIIHSAQGLR